MGKASFTSFDVSGQQSIRVTVPYTVDAVKVLPASAAIKPFWSQGTINFTALKPGQYTLEVNGDALNSLHLFANAPDTDIPSPTAANVAYSPAGTNQVAVLNPGGTQNTIYFAPGVHFVHNVFVASGKTIYLAPGAILYGLPGTTQAPVIGLYGTTSGPLANRPAVLRGRGIIDTSFFPKGWSNAIYATGPHLQISDVVMRNSNGNWNLSVNRANDVQVTNLKAISASINADGIDIVGSQNVTVSNSFIRTYDDLVAIQAPTLGIPTSGVTVQNCILWNEVAHAMTISWETVADVSNVLFTGNDIIHDRGRVSNTTINATDQGTISNVTFTDITMEESMGPIALWIGGMTSSVDGGTNPNDRGHIEDVTFSHFKIVTPTWMPAAFKVNDPSSPFSPGLVVEPVELNGYDSNHTISGTHIENVVIDGTSLTSSNIRQNTCPVSGTTVTP